MKTFDSVIHSPTLPARNTVIWLHGLGADGHDFVDIIPELHLPESLAVRFIFPHAPVRPVSLNGNLPMRAWFDLYELTAESKIDVDGILDANVMLHTLIKHEIAQGIPAENIILAGFSQGGVLALYAGLTYPKRLGGIMGLSTFLPIPALQQTHQPKDIPIFMAHGEYDPLVLPIWGKTSEEYLLKYGYQVAWHTYPMAHTVCMEELQDISSWLIHTLTSTSSHSSL